MKIVPIGSDCLVAWHLKKLGMRKHSFPFDWVKVDNYQGLSNIISALEDDFSTLFTNSEERTEGMINNQPYAYNNSYGLTFLHQNFIPNTWDSSEWKRKLAQSIYIYNTIKKNRTKIIYVFSSSYTGEDYEYDLQEFMPLVSKFESYIRDNYIQGKLVILNTIKEGEDIEHFNKCLEDIADTKMTIWRKLVIDSSDDVYGSSEAFEQSLRKIG